MLQYPQINPIAFNLGHIHVHWYGLMYLFGFMAVWALANYRARRQSWSPLKTNDDIGYVITDVSKDHNNDLLEQLSNINHTIKVRILY